MTDETVFYILGGDDGHEVIPVDIQAWSAWLINETRTEAKNRRVAETIIGEDLYISTVFLTQDHNFTNEGPPILFETMVFRNHSDTYLGQSIDYERCCTWEQAQAMHKRFVEYYQALFAKNKQEMPNKISETAAEY